MAEAVTNLLGIIWKKINDIMDHSIFFRFIDGIFRWVMRLFSGSVAVKLLREYPSRENLGHSKVYRAFIWLFSWLVRMREGFFARAYEGSSIVSFLQSVPPSLLGIRLGRLSVYNCIEGSLLYRFLHKNLGLCLPAKRDPDKKTLWIVLALVVIAALPFFFLPALYAGAAVVGLAGVLLVAAFPELGLIAVTGLTPFFPTMLLAAMLGFTMLCFLLKLLTSKRYQAMMDLTGLFLVVYILVCLFSGVTSFTPGASLRIALLTTLFMLSYFLTLCLINSKEKLLALAFIFSTSAFFTGLYGLYQKFSGKVDMTWVDKELFEGLKLRVFSTFGNPNVYGEYLLLAIPVCLALFYISKSIWAKLYYLGISGVLVLNLGLTYSRGCYLALGFAAFVFVLFLAKRLVVFMSVGIFASPLVLPPGMLERILSITNLADSSTSYRLYIWQATLRIIKHFWYSGLGQGIEAYNTVYPLYAFNGVTAPHSHSLYLQSFVETGIFGLLAFLAVLVCFYKTQIPFFYQSKSLKQKVFSAALMVAVLGFLFQGIFDYCFYNYRVFLTLFIVLGVGNAFVRISKEGAFD